MMKQTHTLLRIKHLHTASLAAVIATALAALALWPQPAHAIGAA